MPMSIVDGFAITGTGTYVYATDTVSWSVKFSGGELDYERSPQTTHVSGTWRGAPVDLTR